MTTIKSHESSKPAKRTSSASKAHSAFSSWQRKSRKQIRDDAIQSAKDQLARIKSKRKKGL